MIRFLLPLLLLAACGTPPADPIIGTWEVDRLFCSGDSKNLSASSFIREKFSADGTFTVTYQLTLCTSRVLSGTWARDGLYINAHLTSEDCGAGGCANVNIPISCPAGVTVRDIRMRFRAFVPDDSLDQRSYTDGRLLCALDGLTAERALLLRTE